MNNWVVIPAAGVGRRMGTDIPKQYLPLAGRTVIDCTVERLLAHSLISGVVVVLAESDRWWNHSSFAQHPLITRVTGGSERSQSVLNGLQHLKEVANDSDWVLVHDAARPCIRLEDIDKLMQAVERHPVGGLLGMPVRDTMKRTDGAGGVLKTVERDNLWHAYTPQMFRLEMLYKALADGLDAGVPLTDEASAMEWAGYQPIMVEGHSDNIKITRPADLALAEYYLS